MGWGARAYYDHNYYCQTRYLFPEEPAGTFHGLAGQHRLGDQRDLRRPDRLDFTDDDNDLKIQRYLYMFDFAESDPEYPEKQRHLRANAPANYYYIGYMFEYADYDEFIECDEIFLDEFIEGDEIFLAQEFAPAYMPTWSGS